MLVRRLLGVAVCCALAIAVAVAAVPALGATRTSENPEPQALWQAYPIEQGTGAAPATPDRSAARTPHRSTTTSSHGSATRRSAATARHIASPSLRGADGAGKRGSALKDVVVVAAVIVGVVVGLIPAVLIAAILGLAPWPRRLRTRRRAPPAPARSAPISVVPAPVRVVFDARPPAPEPPPLRTLAPAPPPAVLDVPDEDEDAVSARDRHHDLYEAAYADQLDRIENLRRAIRTGLAISSASRPAHDAASAAEHDERARTDRG
jgi:hypothetical protein